MLFRSNPLSITEPDNEDPDAVTGGYVRVLRHGGPRRELRPLIVWGMYGEGSGVYGDMYQISNQRTLGFKEEDMIGKLSSMMKNLLQEEREYRNLILERKGYLWVEDRVYRSLGLLSHARTMEEKEAINHFV